MQLAPSKDPEKESKQFSTLGLVFGIAGLFVWYVAIAGIAFSVRGLILSNRIKDSKNRTMAIIGLVASLIGVGYGLLAE